MKIANTNIVNQLINDLNEADKLKDAAEIVDFCWEDDYYEKLAEKHDPRFSILDYAEEVVRRGLEEHNPYHKEFLFKMQNLLTPA